jgi:hypothetical protein
VYVRQFANGLAAQLAVPKTASDGGIKFFQFRRDLALDAASVLLAISAGAVAAISALFSASLSEAAMPITLSSIIRVTARSIPTKAYQATALAIAVIAAMPIKARNSLAFMLCTTRRHPFCGVWERAASFNWLREGADWLIALWAMLPNRSGINCLPAISSG